MQNSETLADSRKQKDQGSSINVKLSRTSSARPLLYSKTNHEMLNRLAVIIQDSKNINDATTKGKLPVEAAYTVMKRVTEAAGEPLIPTGLSTFNKLQSLRTDPALKVLKSQSWKTFFKAGEEGNSPDKGRRPSQASGRLPGDVNNGTIGRTRKDDINASQQLAVLERVFANLILRIEDLWDQLRIPPQERQFYHKTAFKATVDSYEPCKNLALYIEMLELHKELTKDVVFAIHAREDAVKRCYDTLGAIRRKLQRVSILNGNNGQTSGSSHQRPSSANMRNSSSTPSLTEAQVVDESGRMAFWKEELIVSLDEVRCKTLEVIKSIQQWRRILWRPHAFVWCGANYLYKMQDDMNVLETDIYQRILSLVPLTRDDILCVIFSPVATTLASGEPVPIPTNSASAVGNTQPHQQSNQQSSPSSPTSPQAHHRGGGGGSGSFSPSTRPTRRGSSASQNSSSNNNNNNNNNNHQGTTRPQSSSGHRGNNKNNNSNYRRHQQRQQQNMDATLRSLLEAFRDNIDLTELHAAARVVIDEYKLQQALQTEKDALRFKGVFIPLLKNRNDLRDEEDLGYYFRQHPTAGGRNPPANTTAEEEQHQQKRSSNGNQVPFSPSSSNRRALPNENIDDHDTHGEELEDLYDNHHSGRNRPFHFNSMSLEPAAPPTQQQQQQQEGYATTDRYYQEDFSEN